MVNANLGQEYDLAQRLATLERTVRSLSTTPLVDNATISESGQLQVLGNVVVTDPNTGVQALLGILPDGTMGFAQFVGDTTPPPVPSIPTAESGGGVAQVGWDGGWAGVGDVTPPDFARIVVRVNGADGGSIIAAGATPVGGLTVGDTYTFTLLSEDVNGNRSEESAPSAPITIVSSALPPGWDTNLQNQITANANAVTTAQGQLTALGGTPADVVTVISPTSVASAVGQFLALDVGQLTATGTSNLNSVVAQRVAAGTASFQTVTVQNLKAGSGALDSAVIGQLQAQVLTADVIKGTMIDGTTFTGQTFTGGTFTGATVVAGQLTTTQTAGAIQARMGPTIAFGLDGSAEPGVGFSKVGGGALYQAGMYSKDGTDLYVTMGGNSAGMANMTMANNAISTYSYGATNITARGSINISANGPAGVVGIIGNEVDISTVGGPVTVNGVGLTGNAPVAIPSGVNLNTYVTTGVFHQASNSGAAAGTNYPLNAAGLLEVFDTGVFTYQRYTGYEAQNRAFWRGLYNSTWSAWSEYGATAGQSVVSPLSPSGWTSSGSIFVEPFASGNRVSVAIIVTRAVTTALTVTTGGYTSVGTVLPSAALASVPAAYLLAQIVGGGLNDQAIVFINPVNGACSIRAANSNIAIANGALFTIQYTYAQ